MMNDLQTADSAPIARRQTDSNASNTTMKFELGKKFLPPTRRSQFRNSRAEHQPRSLYLALHLISTVRLTAQRNSREEATRSDCLILQLFLLRLRHSEMHPLASSPASSASPTSIAA